jgi:hypothetical protein
MVDTYHSYFGRAESSGDDRGLTETKEPMHTHQPTTAVMLSATALGLGKPRGFRRISAEQRRSSVREGTERDVNETDLSQVVDPSMDLAMDLGMDLPELALAYAEVSSPRRV